MKSFLKLLFCIFLLKNTSVIAQQKQMNKDAYEVAVYYFPQWHVDEQNEKSHGYPWTEWETLKIAKPRFAGHQQPKVPQWGYEDEADPKVMAKKIEVASSHGVDVFLYDWYYKDEGSFLQRCLEDGFLRAKRLLSKHGQSLSGR